MSLSKRFTLWCDSGNCADWYEASDCQSIAPTLRKEAGLYGWARRENRDLCPRCIGITRDGRYERVQGEVKR